MKDRKQTRVNFIDNKTWHAGSLTWSVSVWILRPPVPFFQSLQNFFDSFLFTFLKAHNFILNNVWNRLIFVQKSQLSEIISLSKLEIWTLRIIEDAFFK